MRAPALIRRLFSTAMLVTGACVLNYIVCCSLYPDTRYDSDRDPDRIPAPHWNPSLSKRPLDQLHKDESIAGAVQEFLLESDGSLIPAVADQVAGSGKNVDDKATDPMDLMSTNRESVDEGTVRADGWPGEESKMPGELKDGILNGSVKLDEEVSLTEEEVLQDPEMQFDEDGVKGDRSERDDYDERALMDAIRRLSSVLNEKDDIHELDTSLQEMSQSVEEVGMRDNVEVKSDLLFGAETEHSKGEFSSSDSPRDADFKHDEANDDSRPLEEHSADLKDSENKSDSSLTALSTVMEQSDVVLLSSQANQNDVDYLLSTKNAKLNGGELAFSSENDQESMTRTGNEKFADKKLQGAIERLAQLDTESEATSVEDDDKTTVQTGNERGPAVIAKIASTDTATGKNSTLDPYSSPDTSKRKNVKPWAPNIKLVSSRCVLETIYSSGPSTRLWGRPVAARLQGFHVCPQLNGATFNARATIAFPKGWWDDAKSANGKNISFAAVDACEIVELIESSAEGILSRVRQISPGADSKGQARFACYMAADGRNQFISIITGHGGWSRSLLVNVDPAKYFNKTVPHLFDQGVVTQTYMPGGWCDAFVPPDHESVRPADSATQSSNTSLPRLTRRSRHKSFPVDKLLGNVTESTTRLMGRGSTRQPNVHLRRYKLAYLIMAYQDWRNVCALIDRLWDDHVIVAIHIDTNGRRETQLTKQVSLHINTKYPKAKNIYILPNPVPVYWGHSSIVHAELLGLFSLYEKADWDFVINLSEHDYPLRSNAKIYSELKKGPLIPSPKGSQPLSTDRLPNWFRMWHYQPGKEHIARITRPTWLYPKFGVALSDRKLPLRKFPCPKWDLTIKNSQWFAASRPLVEMLRSSQAFANLLAYMEHSYIPDESIFSLILYNSPYWKQRVTGTNRRLILLTKGFPHPQWLTEKHKEVIKNGAAAGDLFARKVNISSQSDKLLKWIDSTINAKSRQ